MYKNRKEFIFRRIPSCFFLGSYPASHLVPGCCFQAYNTNKKHHNKEQPRGGNRLLEENNSYDNRPQRAYPCPDCVGSPQRQVLRRLGKKYKTQYQTYHCQYRIFYLAEPVRKLHTC